MSQLVAERTMPGGQTLRLIHGDLTEEGVDAIVNAANAQLSHGGGVAGAIVRQGGQEIQAESDAWVQEHGPITHERPAITGAGQLPCRFVIHAVGPIWGEGDEDAKLRAAVLGSLALAEEQSFASLALPAISTGIFGFPKERGANVILSAIVDHFEEQQVSSLREVFAEAFERRWPGGPQPA
jgi:O-acetyl-ADP-ribose deacetylase (regulator of RNase III)